MGYHYQNVECDDFLCKWQNYSRKVPHHPVPDFKLTAIPLPTQSSIATTPSPTTTTTVEAVTNFIKEIITSNTATEETATEAEIITVTENMGNIINSSASDTIHRFQPELNETISSNSSVIFENTTSSSIISTLQNGSFPMEAMQNNATDNEGSILTKISEVASSTAANAISVVNATTENVMQLVQNVTKSHHHSDVHPYKTESHHLLYVILIIIIAILLLIGIILLLIYIRYRKNSFRALHTYYEVSPINGTASSNNEQIEQKETPNEVYMHYNC